MKMMIYILIIVVAVGCKPKSETQTNEVYPKHITLENKTSIPYNLNKPDTLFVMNPKLNEISGLEYDESTDRIVTHNDEKGQIYFLDSNSGKELDKAKFYKSGDYEGVACYQDQVYVVSSNGKIFEYDITTATTEKYQTILTEKNDVEGLCLDYANNQLLIACKGKALGESKNEADKCVYAFDLTTKTFNPHAVFTIENNELVNKVNSHYSSDSQKELEKKIKRIQEFSPSGISYTKNQDAIYIVSARGSTVVVFDQSYKLSSIHFLNPKTIPQPEGICFDKQSSLYISTEGHGLSGKIFKFNSNDQ